MRRPQLCRLLNQPLYLSKMQLSELAQKWGVRAVVFILLA